MGLREEYIADALDDADDYAAWLNTRNVDIGAQIGWVSHREQVESLAAERAEVEARAHIDHVREVAERAAFREGWREMRAEDAA